MHFIGRVAQARVPLEKYVRTANGEISKGRGRYAAINLHAALTSDTCRARDDDDNDDDGQSESPTDEPNRPTYRPLDRSPDIGEAHRVNEGSSLGLIADLLLLFARPSCCCCSAKRDKSEGQSRRLGCLLTCTTRNWHPRDGAAISAAPN